MKVQRVLGGFGALGNPSSFHDPVVRQFRRKIKRLAVRPVMQDYTRRKFGTTRNFALEALFDRLCVRMDDFKSPSAEAWHRDIYDANTYGLRPLPHSLPQGSQDEMFGGWTPKREKKRLGTHLLVPT